MEGVNWGVLEEHGYPEYPNSTLAGKSLAIDETSTDAGQQTLLIGVVHKNVHMTGNAPCKASAIASYHNCDVATMFVVMLF